MSIDPGLAERVAPLHDVTLAQVLSGTATLPDAVNLDVAGVTIAAASVPSPRGDVPVRVYRPADVADPALPALVWCHGGAWVGGDLDMPEAHSVAQHVAASLPGMVVSVDYPLAPAHPHPAARDAIVAVVDHVLAGGLDDTRPHAVALGGASAGGHLAALAALSLRAAGSALSALWMAYPATDPETGPYPLDRPAACPPILWFDATVTGLAFAAYLGGGDDGDAVPARAAVAGLPPTLVTTAGLDALAPQAGAFYHRLAAADVDVTHDRSPALLHGYLNEVAVVPAALQALQRHVAWLRHVLLDPSGGQHP